jgi:hypothetical protein
MEPQGLAAGLNFAAASVWVSHSPSFSADR